MKTRGSCAKSGGFPLSSAVRLTEFTPKSYNRRTRAERVVGTPYMHFANDTRRGHERCASLRSAKPAKPLPNGRPITTRRDHIAQSDT